MGGTAARGVLVVMELTCGGGWGGSSPLFVTWNVRPSRPGRTHRLRGCIGSFEPHALHEGIAEYALISAFKDYRFNKITRGELDALECV